MFEFENISIYSSFQIFWKTVEESVNERNITKYFVEQFLKKVQRIYEAFPVHKPKSVSQRQLGERPCSDLLTCINTFNLVFTVLLQDFEFTVADLFLVFFSRPGGDHYNGPVCQFKTCLPIQTFDNISTHASS